MLRVHFRDIAYRKRTMDIDISDLAELQDYINAHRRELEVATGMPIFDPILIEITNENKDESDKESGSSA